MYESNRRTFLTRDLPLLGSGLCLVASGCEIDKGNEFMADQNRQLGEEIQTWILINRIKMVSKFPEIQAAADLLRGLVDPRKSFPYAGIPVKFSYAADINNASYYCFLKLDEEDPRRIKVTPKNGAPFETPLLKKGLDNSFQISPAVMIDSLRFPVAAKEASQLTENLEYCRLYVDLLKEDGARFELLNLNNTPTSENELISSIAYSQRMAEYSRTGGKSYFADLVDYGSFIRVGGIAFMNWFLDQKRKGLNPAGPLIDTGMNIADFLYFKKLVKEENGMAVWVNGRPSAIASKEFLNLFQELTNRKLTP